jgi:hypothetical protein
MNRLALLRLLLLVDQRRRRLAKKRPLKAHKDWRPSFDRLIVKNVAKWPIFFFTFSLGLYVFGDDSLTGPTRESTAAAAAAVLY